ELTGLLVAEFKLGQTGELLDIGDREIHWNFVGQERG
ncbi:MAG: hypothetical protein RJB19_36, partial [Pseudomonadota bacterium]